MPIIKSDPTIPKCSRPWQAARNGNGHQFTCHQHSRETAQHHCQQPEECPAPLGTSLWVKLDPWLPAQNRRSGPDNFCWSKVIRCRFKYLDPKTCREKYSTHQRHRCRLLQLHLHTSVCVGVRVLYTSHSAHVKVTGHLAAFLLTQWVPRTENIQRESRM